MQNSPSLNNMGGVAPNNKPADPNLLKKSTDNLGPKVYLQILIPLGRLRKTGDTLIKLWPGYTPEAGEATPAAPGREHYQPALP